MTRVCNTDGCSHPHHRTKDTASMADKPKPKTTKRTPTAKRKAEPTTERATPEPRAPNADNDRARADPPSQRRRPAPPTANAADCNCARAHGTCAEPGCRARPRRHGGRCRAARTSGPRATPHRGLDGRTDPQAARPRPRVATASGTRIADAHCECTCHRAAGFTGELHHRDGDPSERRGPPTSPSAPRRLQPKGRRPAQAIDGAKGVAQPPFPRPSPTYGDWSSECRAVSCS